MNKISEQVAECSDEDREAIYLACRIVAVADGRVWREADVLDRIGRQLLVSKKTRSQIHREVKRGLRRCQAPHSSAGKRLMFEFAMDVATADGALSEPERKIARKLGERLGLAKNEIEERLAQCDAKPQRTRRRPAKKSNHKQRDPSPTVASLEDELRGLRCDGGILPSLETEPDHQRTVAGNQTIAEAARSDIVDGNHDVVGMAGQSPSLLKSFLLQLLLVGVGYSVSAIAMGWQFQEMLPREDANEKEVAFGLGILMAGAFLLFSFTHGYIVGSLGLLVFRSFHKINLFEDIKLSEIPGTILFVGFIFLWFGGWFLAPIVFLAGMTAGLSLAWFFVHLALTRPGKRMIAYIEHGSTCLFLVFMGFVFATGNILASVVLLVGQVVLLVAMDQISGASSTDANSGSLNLENMGISLRSDWRSVGDLMLRGVFIVLAIATVFMHRGWQATIDERREARDERREARAKDDVISRRLVAIGGKTSREWSSDYGYVANLKKPNATDNDLAVLRDFSRIGDLKLGGSPITDEGLKHLANIQSIENLDLSITSITDSGMIHLRNVEILEELNLSQTSITDETLLTLEGLESVKRILLAKTKVAGPGLQGLEQCTELIDLDLTTTPIFDDDVQYIEKLARTTDHSQVGFASFFGTRVHLEGTRISRPRRVRLSLMPEITVPGIINKLEQKQTDADSAYELLNLDIDEVISINDKHQVVGWDWDGLRSSKKPNRAVLVNPYDASGDGKPDTYLKDANQDGKNDLLVELGTLPGGVGSVRAMHINNQGQIVGYLWKPNPRRSGNLRRGFIINPLDTDEDGEPDTWFEDGGDGKINRLMTDLGTCKPIGINNLGQIIGTYSNIRGFVIDPRDVDGDGALDWFESAEEGRTNSLMIDLTGSNDLASALPAGINDRGQIVGEIHSFGRWEYKGYPFTLTPRVANNQAQQVWFIDQDGDDRNDLILPVVAEKAGPRERGILFTDDLTRFITWYLKDERNPAKTTIWRMDASGDVTTDSELNAAKVGPQLLTHEGEPFYSRKGHWIGTQHFYLWDWQDINAAGLIIGKAKPDNRNSRAHVAVPR